MKKTVKAIFALLLAVVMVFSLTACTAESKAEKTVDACLKAFCENEQQKAGEYILSIDNEEETKQDDADKKTDPANDAFSENYFKTFKYEILDSEKVNKNTVNVKVKLNTPDMTKILPEYLKLALQLSFASAFDEELTDEKVQTQLDSFMTRSLTDENMARREVEVTAKVVKYEGKWLISAEDEFFDAVLGGMISVGHAMEEAN